MFWWTAFTIGLFGSLHCIGMCGPITFALPFHKNSGSPAWQVLIYHFGRITTYSLLGLLPGLIGQGLSMAGFQKGLSIAMAVVFMLIALSGFGIGKKFFNNRLYRHWSGLVQKWLGSVLKNKGGTSFFSIGLLNGLLPCGLVYAALAGSLTQGHVLGGVLYMFVFGLGTLPMLLLAAFFRTIFSVTLRRRLSRLTPVFMAGMALLFLFRGIRVEIPDSLEVWMQMGYLPMCY